MALGLLLWADIVGGGSGCREEAIHTTVLYLATQFPRDFYDSPSCRSCNGRRLVIPARERSHYATFSPDCTSRCQLYARHVLRTLLSRLAVPAVGNLCES